PTPSDDALRTRVPGKAPKPPLPRTPAPLPADIAPDTYRDEKTLAAPCSQSVSSKPPGKAAKVVGALAVLGLVALPAWIAFGPLRETGDLTLLPVSPQSIRVGESAVTHVA